MSLFLISSISVTAQIQSVCDKKGFECTTCTTPINWTCTQIASCNGAVSNPPTTSSFCIASWINECADEGCGCHTYETLTTFYPDNDHDTFGAGAPVIFCYNGTNIPTGYSLNNLDCNDSNSSVHPGATEICNNIDDNCNSVKDEGCDDDSDTYADSSMVCQGSFMDDTHTVWPCSTHGEDCNDLNSLVHPGAPEICNNADENCNIVKDEGCDDDSDTYADSSMICQGFFMDDTHNVWNCSTHGGDCDDTNPSIWQLLNLYNDSDGDGYGCGDSVSVCSGSDPPLGYSAFNNDCDCANPDKWRLGFAYYDADNDSYGCGSLTGACYGADFPPENYTMTPGDCDCSVASCNFGIHNCIAISYVDVDVERYQN